MGPNSRSTVGTVTDANAMLRVLFSRIAKPRIGPSTAYSFNVPTRRASGAMVADKGKGERTVVRDIDVSKLYDESKSLSEGALKVPGYTAEGWHVRFFKAAGLDPTKPLRKYTAKERDILFYKEGFK